MTVIHQTVPYILERKKIGHPVYTMLGWKNTVKLYDETLTSARDFRIVT